MPGPVRHDEGVVALPRERLVADDRRSLAADDEIHRAGAMAMFFRALAGAEHLHPAADRRQRRGAGDGIDVFERDAVVWAAGGLGQLLERRFGILPAVTQRQVARLPLLPRRPQRSGARLKRLTRIFQRLELVAGIGLVERLV